MQMHILAIFDHFGPHLNQMITISDDFYFVKGNFENDHIIQWLN